jgi:hypothetical protein
MSPQRELTDGQESPAVPRTMGSGRRDLRCVGRRPWLGVSAACVLIALASCAPPHPGVAPRVRGIGYFGGGTAAREASHIAVVEALTACGMSAGAWGTSTYFFLGCVATESRKTVTLATGSARENLGIVNDPGVLQAQK